jgi:hypothetical protein
MRKTLVETLFDESDFDLSPVEIDGGNESNDETEASAKDAETTKSSAQGKPRKIDKPNPEFREEYTKPKVKKSYFSL